MAIIPDATDLGARPVPRRARGIVKDQSAEISAQNLAQFGGAVANIANQFSEREDRFSYAQAKSTLLQADIQARKQLKDDPDWASHETKYQQSMKSALESATKQIRGNRDRAMFGMDAKLDVERGLAEIRNKAKDKEIDWGRSTLDQILEANRAAAMNAGDEATRTQVIGAAKDAILGAQQKGYISEQEATNSFQRFRDSYAQGFLEMQTPEKRIEILNGKGTVADYLQPDVRAKLLEAAKKEGRDLFVRRESQVQEDAIVAKLGTGQAALKAAREIDDPEVRDSTVSRIKIRQAEVMQADIEYQDSLGEQALAFINDGGKFGDLPIRIRNGLKPSTLNSLRSYAENGGANALRKTDPQTLIDLSSKAADDEQAFGELNMMEYRDKLSDGDFEEFVDLQRKIRSGVIDGRTTGFQSITQVRDTRLRELFGSTTAKGAKQTRINDFVMKFEGELKAFKEETGKAPKAEDARKILDNLTAEVAINWGADKKVFEIDDDDIEGVPAADRTEIIRELQKRGKPITDKVIVSLYKQVNAQ